MSRQCVFLLTAGLFFLAFHVALVQQSLAFEGPELRRFRLVLESGERVDGQSAKFQGSFLIGRTDSGDTVRIATANIKLLETTQGSHTLTGFFLGALGGGLLFAGAAAEIAADPAREIDTSRAVPVAIGLVGVGGAIGAAIGSASSTWEEVALSSIARLSVRNGGLFASISF